MNEAGNSWKHRKQAPCLYCKDLKCKILATECLEHQELCRNFFIANKKRKTEYPYSMHTKCWLCPNWGESELKDVK